MPHRSDTDKENSDSEEPLVLGHSHPLLRREDFCEEWIARFAAQAKLLGSPLLSSEEREASLKPFIAGIAPGQDAWVFGYGSLMWNPAFHVAESRPGTIYGYHRSFCVDMLLWRASPDCPGLMLALDRGGSCQGVAHKIAAEQVKMELRILWMREMLGGIYQPRWVQVQLDTKAAVRAITFVANREHPRYIGKLPEATIARRIARAAGEFGNNRQYLFQLEKHLETFGIVDGPMHRFARLVRHLREPEQVESRPEALHGSRTSSRRTSTR
jgi:glutathione-specific gamma-glutamylcyclotransferase